MNNNKIGFVESISLTLIVIISHILLNLPNEILGSTASSGPLNVIYITVLAVIIFLVFNKLFSSFQGKDILDVAEFVGGSILKKDEDGLYYIHYLNSYQLGFNRIENLDLEDNVLSLCRAELLKNRVTPELRKSINEKYEWLKKYILDSRPYDDLFIEFGNESN